MEKSTISRIIATQNEDKVRLEIRQHVDRSGASTDPTYLANSDDERFSAPKAQVGWLTYSKAKLIEHCTDLSDFIAKMEEEELEDIDVGLVDPMFTINGQEIRLALRVVDTNIPSEYDKTRPTRAKRMGEDGDFLLDANGNLIFSYTQVGFVFVEEGYANFASAGSVSRKKVKLVNRELPDDRHEFLDYESQVSRPSTAHIFKESLATQKPVRKANIVEDAPEKPKEQDDKEPVTADAGEGGEEVQDPFTNKQPEE